jgi:hypothetical protein
MQICFYSFYKRKKTRDTIGKENGRKKDTGESPPLLEWGGPP